MTALGMMHLISPDAFKVMIEAAGLPAPSLIGAPLLEILAGVLILAGFFSRIGAVLGLLAMGGALYAHAVINPDLLPASVEMPPLILPILVTAASLIIAFTGGGRWSIDFHHAESVSNV